MTKGKKNNQELWALICEGNEKAFETLYSDNIQDLYSYGLKFTSQNQIVEDCIQELFIRIYKNHKNLGKPQNLKVYLLKSFRNNLIRNIEKERRFSFRSNYVHNFDVVFSIEHKIVKTEEEKKRQNLLQAALAKLSVRQKEAIYLRFSNGLEYDEIAPIMKMSIEACRNIVYRAIKTLRKELTQTSIVLFLLINSN